MALGIAIKKRTKTANGRLRVVDFTGDAAYPLNGYPVTLANLELESFIDMVDVAGGPSGFIGIFNNGTSKLQFFKVGAAGAMVEAAANEAGLNNAVFRALVIGDVPA